MLLPLVFSRILGLALPLHSTQIYLYVELMLARSGTYVDDPVSSSRLLTLSSSFPDLLVYSVPSLFSSSLCAYHLFPVSYSNSLGIRCS